MKYAVFSMDIEDWYHLDYFSGMPVKKTYSMLDGIERYTRILAKHNIVSTFFTLSEIAPSVASQLKSLLSDGHEIACHGNDHMRPIQKSVIDFANEIKQAKTKLEDIIGGVVEGYRAPCFAIDRKRINALINMGFKYDSSKTAFKEHPLYTDIDIKDFTKVTRYIYVKDKFVEFELSTLGIANHNIPVSGGGYLRIFPWILMSNLIKRYISRAELYVFYIHPFELSTRASPPLPECAGVLKTTRFKLGRLSVPTKLEKLIILLKSAGFEFITFTQLRQKVLDVLQNKNYV